MEQNNEPTTARAPLILRDRSRALRNRRAETPKSKEEVEALVQTLFTTKNEARARRLQLVNYDVFRAIISVYPKKAAKALNFCLRNHMLSPSGQMSLAKIVFKA